MRALWERRKRREPTLRPDLTATFVWPDTSGGSHQWVGDRHPLAGHAKPVGPLAMSIDAILPYTYVLHGPKAPQDWQPTKPSSRNRNDCLNSFA
jgi:hypothetical protein